MLTHRTVRCSCICCCQSDPAVQYIKTLTPEWLVDCCSAHSGGAIWCSENPALPVTNFSSNIFADNSAKEGSGGALMLSGRLHTVSNNIFSANAADNRGGALMFTPSCSGQTAVNTVFGKRFQPERSLVHGALYILDANFLVSRLHNMPSCLCNLTSVCLLHCI